MKGLEEIRKDLFLIRKPRGICQRCWMPNQLDFAMTGVGRRILLENTPGPGGIGLLSLAVIREDHSHLRSSTRSRVS